MIRSVVSNSPYLTVSTYGGGPGYISPGSQAGQVRFNTSTSEMEVFDGISWKNMSGHADISLSPEAIMILEWGRKKMARETELRELAEQHPTVASALEALRNAEAQLDIVAILCKEEQ